MNESHRIVNRYNEQIDVLVHGFGTGKDEGFSLFKDISVMLQKDFRLVRFDFTGCGNSEGNQEDVNLEKQVDDLQTIITWTRKSYGKQIHIIAHSMGTFVTALLSPNHITKTYLPGYPMQIQRIYMTD